MTLTDNGMVGKKIAPGADTFHWSLFSIAVDIKTNFQTPEQLVGLREYLRAPEGLSAQRGSQVDTQHTLLQYRPDAEHVVEVTVPRPSAAANPAGEALLLPLRAGPFNSRWTVGLFQVCVCVCVCVCWLLLSQ